MGKYEQYADDLLLCVVNDSKFYHKATAIEHTIRHLESVWGYDLTEMRTNKFYKLAKKAANYFTAQFPSSYHNDGLTCACLMRALIEEFSTMEF